MRMRKLETYIEKIEDLDWYTKDIRIADGKITGVTFKCEKGTAVLTSTERHFIFNSDFLKPFTIDKLWFEWDTTFNDLDPKHYKYISGLSKYELFETTDDREDFIHNVGISLESINCDDSDLWDIVNNDDSTIEDIEYALKDYGYDDEDIENLHTDFTEDYLTFMAILAIARKYAKDEGYVTNYKPYDRFEKRYEAEKKDKEFVFQLIKDREHGNWNGDKVAITKRGERKYLFEYDDNMATICIVGRHPYLESWKVGERRIFEK